MNFRLCTALLCATGYLFLSLLLPSRTHAAILFSDSFDQGLLNWQPTSDTGSMWSVHPGYIEAFVPNVFQTTELIPKTWKNTSLKSYRYHITFTPLQGVDRLISFGYQNESNWYQIHFAQGVTELSKISDGDRVWFHHEPYHMLNGKEYEAVLEFDAGEISLTINDQLLLSVVDPTYSGETGLISLRAGTGAVAPARVQFSEVKVETLDETTDDHEIDVILPVELLRQDDPEWAHLEYDSASVWSKNLDTGSSFKDWACNLVSQVMILRFHGINQLPDGTNITPISYNNWLLQHNGYWNTPHTGNIARTSPSLLSAAVHEVFGTPKLEFGYTANPSSEQIIAEISSGRPAILELDGHFVVATGYTADQRDIFINDPAYDIDRLSLHPLELISMRTYYPTLSDLRYFELSTENEVEVNVLRDDDAVGVLSTERVRSNNPIAVFSPTTKVWSQEKPKPGEYMFTLHNESQDAESFTLVHITKTGERQEIIHDTIAANSSRIFSLDYQDDRATLLPEPKSEDTDSTPTPTLSGKDWKQFRKKVISLYDEHSIKQSTLTATLLKSGTVLEKVRSPLTEKILIRMAIITIDSAAASTLSESARSTLKDMLL